MSNLKYHIESGFTEYFEIGEGNIQIFKGFCFHTEKKIKQISVIIGHKSFFIRHISEPSHSALAHYPPKTPMADQALTSGFLELIPITKDFCGTSQPITLRVNLEDGGTEEISLGVTHFVYRLLDKPYNPPQVSNPSSPLVAICLATYKPEPAAFHRQIDSIINQSYRNWICIINDDASPSRSFRHIRDICYKDPRFVIFRNDNNQGFYKNFESCLRKVPETAAFVAFCDQDDYWYPGKLEKCLSAFKDGTMLVYSDMRIVAADGEVLFPTYWFSRKNYYQDLDLMLLANTVTGAASVFRMELLPRLLPFPTRIGDIFHDHWLACTALMAGSIEYVDEPLHDYYQHGANAIGHCTFGTIGYWERLRKWWQNVKLAFHPAHSKTRITRWRNQALAVYHYEYLRIHLITEILRLRFPNTTRVRRRALDAFNNTWRTPLSLMRIHFKVWRRGETTDDAEFRLAGSYLMNVLNKLYVRLFRSRIARAIRESVRKGIEHQRQATAGRVLLSKIAPLTINVDAEQPKRINLLIPEINFSHFFGGYMGKFNFAKRLLDYHYQVRLIMVDWCNYKPEEWEKLADQYEGLQDFFQKVEVEYCFNRANEVAMNPDDTVIATTWWTAHIAHAALQSLNRKRFIYFIQEYEPFTFAMGSYFATAHESYQFPHYALFSTDLLMDFFKSQKIGIFSDSFGDSSQDARFFRNAILKFDVNIEDLKIRNTKKLLFYARPEPHAARNMFETALAALSKTIESGVFGNEPWEFHGIGTTQANMLLPRNITLKMLGKMGLHAYRDLLPEYDIGLSLMYTPHPSLVPLEMAAAGQLVVTNSCLNKTRERMAELSSNIIAGEPTIEGVASSLREAVSRANNYEERITGTRVAWPTTWEETFSEEVMGALQAWVQRSR